MAEQAVRLARRQALVVSDRECGFVVLNTAGAELDRVEATIGYAPGVKSGFEAARAALLARNGEIDVSGHAFARNVHRARAQSKRLAAALRLFRPCLSARACHLLKHRIKSSAAMLAGHRDAHVIGEQLRAVGQPIGVHGEVEKWIHAHLEDSGRSTALAKLRRSRKMLDRIVEGWPFPKKSMDLPKLFAQGVKSSRSKAKAALVTARQRRRVEDFHDLRKRAKWLLLQLQLAREIGLPCRRNRLRRVDGLQEKLGAVHDLAIAEERVAGAIKPVARALSERRIALEKKILKSASKALQGPFLK